jgi:hypothetical protein
MTMHSINKKFGLLLIFLVLILLFFNGCVRRRMTVRSNPPGATVYLDGKEIGRTPFSTNFDFYGKREFRVVKQGYETKTVLLPVPTPWYELPGIDFISEVLLPGKLTDHKYYEFDMKPEQITPTHELVGRAEDLRRLAHAEGTLQINSGNIPHIPATPITSSPNPEF